MRNVTRIGTGIGAALLTVGLVAGAYVSGQNTAGEPGPFMQRGPGGPDRGGAGGFIGRGGPGRGGALAGLPIGRLNLSEAQREQLRTITESHQAQVKPVLDRVRELRRSLDEAVTADGFDEGLIRSRAAELALAEADLAIIQARMRADIVQQVLTPEQRERAKQLQAQRDNQGRQGKPGGQGRRDAPGR